MNQARFQNKILLPQAAKNFLNNPVIIWREAPNNNKVLFARPFDIIRNTGAFGLAGIAIGDIVASANGIVEGNTGTILFSFFHTVFFTTRKPACEEKEHNREQEGRWFHVIGFIKLEQNAGPGKAVSVLSTFTCFGAIQLTSLIYTTQLVGKKFPGFFPLISFRPVLFYWSALGAWRGKTRSRIPIVENSCQFHH